MFGGGGASDLPLTSQRRRYFRWRRFGGWSRAPRADDGDVEFVVEVLAAEEAGRRRMRRWGGEGLVKRRRVRVLMGGSGRKINHKARRIEDEVVVDTGV